MLVIQGRAQACDRHAGIASCKGLLIELIKAAG
jgi:hypothetical protein